MLLVGCGRPSSDGAWSIGEDYSVRLLTPTLVGGRPIYDLAPTVDTIQIYRTQKPQEYLRTIDEVRAHKWIYETNNRDEIAEFFNAARQKVEPAGCLSTMATTAYLVLAFDRDLLRVAFYKYFPCEGRDFGMLDPIGSPGLFYSAAIAPLIERDRLWPSTPVK